MKNECNEIWKDVKGYEGLYQVSNLGNVRKMRFINNKTDKEKIFYITPQTIKTGYKKIILYKNGEYKNMLVHRLVAETFIPNDSNKKCVNHIDGNKENNMVENLEWCTYSENMKHAYKNDLRHSQADGKFGSNNPKSLNVLMIDKFNNRIIKEFGSLIEAANYVGAKSSSHICACCKGKLKTAYGYRWQYASNTNV